MHSDAKDILALARGLEEAELIEVHSGDREPGGRVTRIGQQWLVDGLKLLAERDNA